MESRDLDCVQGVDVLRWEFLPTGRCCAPRPWHSMVHLQVQGHFCVLVVKYPLDSLAVISVKLLMSVGSAVTAPAWDRTQSLFPAKLPASMSSLAQNHKVRRDLQDHQFPASLVVWDYRTALGGKCF